MAAPARHPLADRVLAIQAKAQTAGPRRPLGQPTLFRTEPVPRAIAEIS